MVLFLALQKNAIQAFLHPTPFFCPVKAQIPVSLTIRHANNNFDDADEWESDFDDFDDAIGGGNNDDNSPEGEGALKLSDVIQSQGAQDLSSCRVRQVRDTYKYTR